MADYVSSESQRLFTTRIELQFLKRVIPNKELFTLEFS